MAAEACEQPAAAFALLLDPQQCSAQYWPVRHVIWVETARGGPAQLRDPFQCDAGQVDEGGGFVGDGLAQLSASANLACFLDYVSMGPLRLLHD
jgi:hypothetical protein